MTPNPTRPAEEEAPRDGRRERTILAMEEVLAGESFCNSQQSQKLLRYLLQHTLDGHDDLLRERAIGVEVFGKQPGYDTNEDSIVRVRANELRKRLAKHYQSLAEAPAVRFSMPPGSYRLEIQEQQPPAAAPVEPELPGAPAVPAELPVSLQPADAVAGSSAGSRRRVFVAAGAICGFLALAVAIWFGYGRWFAPKTALDRFWEPALRSDRPVVICIPHPVLYGFTRDFRQRVTGAPTSHSRNLMDALELDPNLTLKGSDIVTIRDQFVGVGTAHATAAASAFLAERHKASVIRFGNDVSFEDFRHSPTVLLAAFSNRWTLDLTSSWRFVFAESEGLPCVEDKVTRRLYRLPSLQPNGRTQEDYAIISRIFQSETGSFLISAAGITQYGTRSAGEFITNPTLLERAVAALPSDWRDRNIQVLIRVRIVGQVPAEPEIVASHCW